MYKEVNGEKMSKYITTKYNWCKVEQTLINWNAIGDAMNTYSEYKKTKIIQLMYDWQHDETQKLLFKQNSENVCPMNCGETKNHNHYLYCKDDRMQNAKMRLLQRLKQTLTKMNTHPIILNAIQTMLREGEERASEKIKREKEPIAILTTEAINENQHLSQSSFAKGFHSMK